MTSCRLAPSYSPLSLCLSILIPSSENSFERRYLPKTSVCHATERQRELEFLCSIPKPAGPSLSTFGSTQCTVRGQVCIFRSKEGHWASMACGLIRSSLSWVYCPFCISLFLWTLGVKDKSERERGIKGPIHQHGTILRCQSADRAFEREREKIV